MKILRSLSWLVAVLPVVAVAYMAAFAARLPEPWFDRLALGEAATAWQWRDCVLEHQGPMHIAARGLYLAALHVPGASCASVVWLNVLFATLLTMALTGLTLRAVPPARRAAPFVFAFFGLWTCAPQFGANWLFGERAPQVLVPLLFAAATFWLHGLGRFAGRALLVMLLAMLAPFCHVHGIVVALALVPALLGAARRNDKRGAWWWAGAMVVLSAAASVYTLLGVEHLGAATSDWLRELWAAPGERSLALLRATGGMWLDLLPGVDVDELALGAASWLLVVVLPWLGDRSPAGREVAAPWWSCICFGLLVIVLAGLRYELVPPIGSLREATSGAFLLPLGAIGLLGARFGRPLFVFGAGALTVLALQDWLIGIEDLRLARMRADAAEAAYCLPEFALPESVGTAAETMPVRPAEALEQLRTNGWIPPIDDHALSLPNAFAAPPIERYGSVAGGTASRITGELRSSLRDETVTWLFVLSKTGDEPAKVIANARPVFAGVGRQVAWTIELAEPIADGGKVRVVGFLPRTRALPTLGPVFVVTDGKLVPEAP